KLASEISEMLEAKGKGKGIKEPSGVREGNPDLLVQPDPVRMARYNLSTAELSRQLQAMFLGQVATQVRESSLRITDVRVRYPDRIRVGPGLFDPERVLNQWILLPESAPLVNVSPTLSTSTPLAGPARTVPLAALARLERVRSADEQWRENQQ